MRLSVVCLVGAIGALETSGHAEEPTVHVRARTRLEVGATERTPSGLALEGTLVDEASNEGVKDAVVRVDLEGQGERTTQEVTTKAGGVFRVELPGALGEHRLRVEFDGDRNYAAAPAFDRRLDLSRRPVSLALALPRRVRLEEGVLPVEVTAREAGLVVELDVEEVVAARMTLDGGGHGAARLALPAGVIAGSSVTVRARFAGDAQRDSAEATRSAQVTAASRLDAALAETAVARGEPLVIAGALGDARGPLEGERVETDGASALTDEKGQFRLELPTDRLAPGPLAVEVRYRPPYPFRDEARRSLRATLLPPRPVPLGWYLVVPSLLAAAGTATWLVRRRPWRRWRRLWAVRRRRGPRHTTAAATARRSANPGVVESRPSRIAALRRATDCGLDGVVWDHAFDRPIGDAGLSAGPEIAVVTDEHGRFALDLAPGTFRITVSAPGYLTETFERALPHRGELRGLRVRLQPIRARVLALYAAVAQPLLPAAALWSTWTPRELLEHVRRHARPGPPALAALTDLVEEAYYSGRVPGNETLAAAEALAARLQIRPSPAVPPSAPVDPPG